MYVFAVALVTPRISDPSSARGSEHNQKMDNKITLLVCMLHVIWKSLTWLWPQENTRYQVYYTRVGVLAPSTSGAVLINTH